MDYEAVSETKLNMLRESYGRCLMHKNFFKDFYDSFVGSTPEMAHYFKNTNMQKQYKLLREGISFLLLYAEKSKSGTVAIEKISELHDKNHVNVRPEHYKFWINSFLENVAKYDHKFTDELKRDWEDLLRLGINRFIEVYEKTEKKPESKDEEKSA